MLSGVLHVDINRLDLRVSPQSVDAILSSVPRILESAERNVDFRVVVRVDEDGSGLELSCDTVTTGQVSGRLSIDSRKLLTQLTRKTLQRPVRKSYHWLS